MNTPFLDGITKEAGIPWATLADKPWILPAIGGVAGGGAGALVDKENRLRGGLIGAGGGAALGLVGTKVLRSTKLGKGLQVKDLRKKLFTDSMRDQVMADPGVAVSANFKTRAERANWDEFVARVQKVMT